MNERQLLAQVDHWRERANEVEAELRSTKEQQEVYEENLKAYSKTITGLKEQLEALERALRAIAFNAESFHKGEDGKERALKVILAWATDPKLVPEGVGYPAKQREDSNLQ